MCVDNSAILQVNGLKINKVNISKFQFNYGDLGHLGFGYFIYQQISSLDIAINYLICVICVRNIHNNYKIER